MPRPRKYENAAERQRAYRERQAEKQPARPPRHDVDEDAEDPILGVLDEAEQRTTIQASAVSLDRRLREWAMYPFIGTPEEIQRKRLFLAHMEEEFTVVATCRAADVLRYEFRQWAHDDEVFSDAVEEAYEACVQRVETVMYQTAIYPDSKGKVNTTACFGILNSKADDWGLLKAQLLARQNGKLIDECAAIILAEVPSKTADKIREKLNRLRDRSSRMPSGASLR